ncbi:MAG: gephyrin-like molybdotransferase Glp [Paracoccaceae bacterium]
MISVETALDQLLALVRPLDVEAIPLISAAGRTLSRDVRALRDQPPFAASSMDGYAIRADEAQPASMFKVMGESAAGHGWSGTVGPGQAVRIFTGAPVPHGANFIVIQEDTERRGDLITLNPDLDSKDNIRPAGIDFRAGDAMHAPRVLEPQDVALLASMNIASVPVRRKPIVAVMATGDELVMPGEKPGPDQIIASNSFGLHAMLEALGATPRLLPIARDNENSLKTAFDMTEGADLIVTIGGASVGDHDLVGDVAQDLGLERSFYKVAMRPGKPLMAGRFGAAAMIGLPGNPVSAMVCGHVFVAPMIRAMLGQTLYTADLKSAPLAAPLGPNGPRTHYMRAVMKDGKMTAADQQDSSLLTVLAESNALLVRAPHDPAREIGEVVQYLPI